MRSFWYLIKDHDNKIFDILGPISNDDSYNLDSRKHDDESLVAYP